MGDRQFGPYGLVHQIAVGGMAEIHLARTGGLAGFEKYVALKMIHPNFSSDDQFIQMLIDEAKITVQLQHVNIAQTFDLGRVGDTYYITMEYVDGCDLYQLLRKGSEQDREFPVDVAAFITKEVATGLDYAHRKRDHAGRPLGIVHRDVSPQNVLISHAGEVKIVDFGIAKATMRVRQTAVGVIKGKYYYMSPEQAWGDSLDHRTDIFSCGILLYELLTGQMLYLEEDVTRLLDMVRRAEIAPPTVLRKGIPPQLERIVMHALAKRPDDRYLTAVDLATDLERFLHAYSPVFTASKLARYTAEVMGTSQPPVHVAAAPPVEPSSLGPERPITRRLVREDFVRDRSEFTDENSVIFRMAEMAQSLRSREHPGEDTATHLPHGGLAPLPSVPAPGPPPRVRSPRGLPPLPPLPPLPRRPTQPEPALAAVADDDRDGFGDDRTIVDAAPPSFSFDEAAAPVAPPALPLRATPFIADTSSLDFDTTDVSTDWSGVLEPAQDVAPTMSLEGPLQVHPRPEELDAPTRHDVNRADREPNDPLEAPTIRRSRTPDIGQPDVLAARNQPPAVSAVRPPRQSRRTPACRCRHRPPSRPARPSAAALSSPS
jgi:serine/threonine protein kinase